MLTLKILPHVAYVQGPVGPMLASMERPGGVTQERWHDVATDWGAKVIGTVLAAKGGARG
jgi:hypothetical protein